MGAAEARGTVAAMLFRPVGWEPAQSASVLDRYPEQLVVTATRSVLDVIYQAVAGRVASDDEAARNERSTRLEAELIAALPSRANWSTLRRTLVEQRTLVFELGGWTFTFDLIEESDAILDLRSVRHAEHGAFVREPEAAGTGLDELPPEAKRALDRAVADFEQSALEDPWVRRNYARFFSEPPGDDDEEGEGDDDGDPEE